MTLMDRMELPGRQANTKSRSGMQVVGPSARTRRRHTAKIQKRQEACARRDQARQLKQSMAQMRATCKKHSQ